MDKQRIIEQINSTLMKEFEIKVDIIRPEALLREDLGLDSLDAVDMLVHFQDQIGISVDPEKFQTAKSLADVYEIVFEVMTPK